MAGIVRGDRVVAGRRAALALIAGGVALYAFAGSILLVAGRIHLVSPAEDALPWLGEVAVAVLLAVIVAVPMAVTAGSAAAGDRRATGAAVTAGVLLICWILAQMTVLRTLSWLQPLYLILGIAVAGLGLHIRTAEIET